MTWHKLNSFLPIFELLGPKFVLNQNAYVSSWYLSTPVMLIVTSVSSTYMDWLMKMIWKSSGVIVLWSPNSSSLTPKTINRSSHLLRSSVLPSSLNLIRGYCHPYCVSASFRPITISHVSTFFTHLRSEHSKLTY